MNCTIPLNDDPTYFEAVKRIMIREDIRLWKGDAAVDKFDRMWRDDQGELNLHPDLQQRIEDVIEAMTVGQTAPGLWQEPDGTCHQDWITLACFARWFHAVDVDNRQRALEQIANGNKEPWWDPDVMGSEMTDMPYACGGSDKNTCCPKSVYEDEQYHDRDPEAGPTGSTGFSLFVVAASMIAAAVAVPKLMNKWR